MFYKRIEFESEPGENIHHYAARAHKELQRYKDATYGVYLAGNFNDIRMVMPKDITPQLIVQEYHCRLDDKCRTLQDYKRYQINDLQKAQYSQMLELDIKAMINRLQHRTFKRDKDLLYWIKDFTILINDVKSDFDKQLIIDKLKDLGYEFVGPDVTKDTITIDNIIGNVIRDLELLDTIPLDTIEDIDYYLNLKKEDLEIEMN